MMVRFELKPKLLLLLQLLLLLLLFAPPLCVSPVPVLAARVRVRRETDLRQQARRWAISTPCSLQHELNHTSSLRQRPSPACSAER